MKTDGPLADQAAALFAEEWRQQDLPDLSSLTVIVPTRHAGRRLREALALSGHRERRAIIPPVLHTQESLLSKLAMHSRDPETNDHPPHPTASDAETHWAMVEALRTIPSRQLEALFPRPGHDRPFPWLLAAARSICSMRRTLAGGRLSIATIVDKFETRIHEKDRWQVLARVESLYLDRLRDIRRQDFVDAMASMEDSSIAEFLASSTMRRLILVGLPELMPAFRSVLEVMEATPEPAIEAWIYRDSAEAGDFDRFGMPVPEKWNRRPLPWGESCLEIERCLEPSSMIRSVEKLLRSNPGPATSVAIGIVDPEITDQLESHLSAAGFELFNPAGRSCHQSEIHHFLSCWHRHLQQPGLSTAIELARIRDVSRAAAGDVPQPRLLEALDRLRVDYLVESLEGITQWLPGDEASDGLHSFLDWIIRWTGNFNTTSWKSAIPAMLSEVYSGRSLRDSRREDRAFVMVSQSVNQVLDSMSALPDIPGREALEILLGILGSTRFYEEREGQEVDLPGWMELLWESAPLLPVAGFQDHVLPESVSADIFLPEKFRHELGLPVNRDREARDAFILHSLVAARRKSGAVRLYFSDVNDTGDPLRPSRLAFLCKDTDLPERVTRLLGESSAHPSENPAPVFQNSFRLRIPSPPKQIERISVTAFSRYLECPFRYYLSDVLGMEQIPRLKMELDAMEFGSLFHKVLEDYGRDQDINAMADPGKIRSFLHEALDRNIHGRYGNSLPASLWIQRESLIQRLSHVADIEAQQRAEGWQIIEVELRIHHAWEEKFGSPWTIGGLKASGVIDRIEQHAGTGAFRLLDFKTSTRGKTPLEAHFLKMDDRDPWLAGRPDWQCCEPLSFGSGRSKIRKGVWKNIQLPLYAMAFMGLHQTGDLPSIGYFNAPSTVTETGLMMWDDFNHDMLRSAVRCAGAVAGAIAGRVFHPPNPSYQDLFHRETFPPFFIQSPEMILDLSGIQTMEARS